MRHRSSLPEHTRASQGWKNIAASQTQGMLTDDPRERVVLAVLSTPRQLLADWLRCQVGENLPQVVDHGQTLLLFLEVAIGSCDFQLVLSLAKLVFDLSLAGKTRQQITKTPQ